MCHCRKLLLSFPCVSLHALSPKIYGKCDATAPLWFIMYSYSSVASYKREYFSCTELYNVLCNHLEPRLHCEGHVSLQKVVSSSVSSFTAPSEFVHCLSQHISVYFILSSSPVFSMTTLCSLPLCNTTRCLVYPYCVHQMTS